MGPLDGIRVIEFAGIGPVPFCGQLLADLGADVVVVERASAGDSIRQRELSGRSRRSIAVDLKNDDGLEVVRRLVAVSDVLLEGFRPGVMERMGLGPDECRELNPRIVYGRMTGYGQTGPLADTAGHDINYLALAGVLEAVGPPERPIPPLNLVADYGGGAMFLAVGVLAALVERDRSGVGQVVDAAMVEGAASLMEIFYTMSATGSHDAPRGANMLDGGAPFYRTYQTADGRWMAVGALEPKFYAEMLAGLDIETGDLPAQWDVERWPELEQRIAAAFASADRDTWERRFSGTDACVTPVLDRSEAPRHPHNLARGVFTDASGIVGPAPAPRFDRTPAAPPRPTGELGADTETVLAELGYDEAERTALRRSGSVR